MIVFEPYGAYTYGFRSSRVGCSPPLYASGAEPSQDWHGAMGKENYDHALRHLTYRSRAGNRAFKTLTGQVLRQRTFQAVPVDWHVC